VIELLYRRTGVAAAQFELEAATDALASASATAGAADRYDTALLRSRPIVTLDRGVRFAIAQLI
jgi:hypothetical protein